MPNTDTEQPIGMDTVVPQTFERWLQSQREAITEDTRRYYPENYWD
jgi:hypothetical protein